VGHGEPRVAEGLQRPTAQGRQVDEAHPQVGRRGRGVATGRPAVHDDLVAARHESATDLFDTGLEAAVARRNPAGADQSDAHSGPGPVHVCSPLDDVEVVPRARRVVKPIPTPVHLTDHAPGDDTADTISPVRCSSTPRAGALSSPHRAIGAAEVLRLVG
jgi:hypothetical protein